MTIYNTLRLLSVTSTPGETPEWKKNGDAHCQIWIKSLKGFNLDVAWPLFDPHTILFFFWYQP